MKQIPPAETEVASITVGRQLVRHGACFFKLPPTGLGCLHLTLDFEIVVESTRGQHGKGGS